MSGLSPLFHNQLLSWSLWARLKDSSNQSRNCGHRP